MAVPIEEIIRKLNETGREVIFLGDGVSVYKKVIEQQCSIPYSFAPAHVNKQRAGALAALAQQYFREGKIEDPAEHNRIIFACHRQRENGWKKKKDKRHSAGWQRSEK